MGESLNQIAGINIVNVPYKGSQQAAPEEGEGEPVEAVEVEAAAEQLGQTRRALVF